MILVKEEDLVLTAAGVDTAGMYLDLILQFLALILLKQLFPGDQPKKQVLQDKENLANLFLLRNSVHNQVSLCMLCEK